MKSLSTIAKGISSRAELCIVCLLFVVAKIPHLFYPYYWDESWAYAPAIKQMYKHGISLLPNALDGELSRGHPLFFHALGAFWMNMFGDSHPAMHSLPLLISICFLISIYEAGIRIFNKNVAVLSLILVAGQVAFFVQSSYVLFEILIAYLMFMSIVFYAREKYLWSAITLTIVFYTKESGLIAGFVIGLDALFSVFKRNETWKIKLIKLATIGVPCIAIAIFFLLQKQLRGWYILPYHYEIIENKWVLFWHRFRMGCIRQVFYESLRVWIFALLLGFTVFAAFKSKKFFLLALFLPALIIFYYIDDLRAGRILPGIPFFILFIAALFWLFFEYGKKKYFESIIQSRIIYLMGSFIFCFLCFSAMNYFTFRYLISALVPTLFVASVFIDLMIRLTYKWLYYVAICCILIIIVASFATDDGIGDCNLGSFRAMEVQQATIDYFVQNKLFNKAISSASFLQMQHLLNPATGFLKDDQKFYKIKYDINYETEYIIFDNIEPDPRYQNIKSDTTFQCVFRKEKKDTWCEIYRRK